MNPLVAFATDTWILNLPEDWSEQGQVEGGTLYFESADGTRGLYIATWRVADDVPARAALARFQQTGLQTLWEMEGYDWALLGEAEEESGGILSGVTDCLAPSKQYRVIGKVLVRAPIVVRAAFHHYLCEDYAASQREFAPLLASLRLREAD